jgi:hypothetical protein
MLIGSAASAATILSTDFTEVTTDDSSGTVSNVSWDTVTGLNTPASTLNFVGNSEDGGGTLGFFDTADLISVDYNLSNEGSFEFTIANLSLDGGTSAIDLTALSLLLDGTTNSGATQVDANDRALEVTVELIGSSSGSLGTSSFSADEPGGGTGTTYTVDLTSFPSLGTSESYDFIINIDDVAEAGVNASMDDFLLTGNLTAIPEPSTLFFIGLIAGSVVLRRKRR